MIDDTMTLAQQLTHLNEIINQTKFHIREYTHFDPNVAKTRVLNRKLVELVKMRQEMKRALMYQLIENTVYKFK